MMRPALVLIVLSSCQVCQGQNSTVSTDHFSSAWQELLDRQLTAAEAEHQCRQMELTSLERLHQVRRVSDDELQQARELTAHAAEWAHVLRRQRQQFDSIESSGSRSARQVCLRVPGVPLAFLNDEYSFVAVPDTPRTRVIAGQLEELIAERRELSAGAVRQQFLSDHCGELREIVRREPARHSELTFLELQRQAAPFDPMTLDELLLSPLRHAVTSDPESAESFADWTATAQSWVVHSRQLLIEQAVRGREQQQERLRQSAANDAPAGEPADSFTAEQERLEKTVHSLQREIHVAAGIGGSRQDPTAPTQNSSLLMRIAKESHDSVRQELDAIRQETTWLADRLQTLSGDKAADPERSMVHREHAIAAARQQQLVDELARRRALVRYAMTLYRLESGRDTDTAVMRQERTALFLKATELQSDLNLIALRTELLQSHISQLQPRSASSPMVANELRRALVEAAVLEVEQRRTELQMKIAHMSLRLLRLADSAPAIARN